VSDTIDTTKMTNRELGYLILHDLIGADPTRENIMLWYTRQRQHSASKSHL
jgi:hypothetical protein